MNFFIVRWNSRLGYKRYLTHRLSKWDYTNVWNKAIRFDTSEEAVKIARTLDIVPAEFAVEKVAVETLFEKVAK